MYRLLSYYLLNKGLFNLHHFSKTFKTISFIINLLWFK